MPGNGDNQWEHSFRTGMMCPVPDLIETLLSEIDPLPYPARMRFLAGRARATAGTGELDALLDALAVGDLFQRRTGLFLATVAGHRRAVERAMDDDDLALCAAALSVWLRSGAATADALWDRLADAPASLRRAAYRSLRRGRLGTLADALIDRVRVRYGDTEAARLLPACTEEQARRLLPELAYAIRSWTAVAGSFPGLALAEAARQLAEAGPASEDWWARFDRFVWTAAPHRPEQVLDLLEAYAPANSLPGPLSAYGVLAAADPHRVLAMLTAPSRVNWTVQVHPPRPLLRRLGALPAGDLAGLARLVAAKGFQGWLEPLLAALPPARRERLYDLAYADLERNYMTVDQDVLHLLPRTRQISEARHVYRAEDTELPGTDMSPFLVSLRPWAQAKGQILAWIRRGTAEDRGRGYHFLIECAHRSGDPAAITEVLSGLEWARNEREPVRQSILNALIGVRPRLFEPGAAGLLERITTDTTQARDGSPTTRRQLQQLALGVLRQRADSPELVRWALRTLVLLCGEDPLPGLDGLSTLRSGQEQDFFAAVRDQLRTAAERGRYEPLLAVAAGLGRHAGRLPELLQLLRGVIDPAIPEPAVRRAIELWLADPRTRDARVTELVRQDVSTVAVPLVWAAVSARRTDLVDLVLGDAPSGMFRSARTRRLPIHPGTARRWLPRQQARLAQLLGSVADDAALGRTERAGAIRQAARLPDAGRAVVHRHLGSSEVALAEAALHGLGWTDPPAQALPVLLAHTADDRARVAVFAAGRAAAHLHPSRLHAILETALDGAKVTSRKEILRLAVRFAVPGAGGLLLRQWARDAHPDVRAAIAVAACRHLDWAESWQILDEAVHGPREAALAALAADPYAVHPADRLRYGALVETGCASADPDVARAAWSAVRRWVPWTPNAEFLLADRLLDLGEEEIWKVSGEVLVLLCDLGRGERLLTETMRRLVELDRVDDDRDLDHDRAARRRIVKLADAFSDSRRPNRPVRSRLLEAVGAELMDHPEHVPVGAAMRVRALRADPDRLRPVFADIAARLADRPVAAIGLHNNLLYEIVYVARDRRPEHEEMFLTVARELAARPDTVSGLLAVSLATTTWTEPWRELIRGLRRHPDPDVRTAARDTELSG